MSKIKMRDKVKDVKVFDRAADVGRHTKNTVVKSKETIESADRQAKQIQDSGYTSPSEYASDQMTDGATDMTARAAHGLKKNPVKQASGNISKAKQNMQTAKRQISNAKSAVKNPAASQPKNEMVRRAKQTAQRTNVQRTATQRTASHTRQAAETSVKAIQQSDKTIKTASKTVKGTAQATQRTVKTARHTAKVTVKTARQTAKATKAAAKSAQKTAQIAKSSAKIAAKMTKVAIRATIAAIKSIIAATKTLIALIAAGGWIAVIIILIICFVALIVGSAFGVFFSNDNSLDNSMTVSQAVAEINGEFQADIQSRIDELTARDSYDEVRVIYEGDMEGDSDIPNNWTDVLTVYAVKFTSDNMEVLTFDESRKAALRDIFFSMNQVSVRHEIITEVIEVESPPPSPTPSPQPSPSTTSSPAPSPQPETRTIKTLIIYIHVDSQTYEQAAARYSFTAEQMRIADEMMSPQFYSLFVGLLGVDIYGGADLTNIISNLPNGTKGAAIVEAALTRLGHPYSQARRGQGNYLDCSYLTMWAYGQAGVSIPSTSVEQARFSYNNGYNIGRSELQPGDLVFWSKLNCHCGRWNEIHHVGIYIGGGKVIEASAGRGRVVINDLWGENGTTWRIHSYSRPYI